MGVARVFLLQLMLFVEQQHIYVHECDCISTGGNAGFAHLETVNNQMKKLIGL